MSHPHLHRTVHGARAAAVVLCLGALTTGTPAHADDHGPDDGPDHGPDHGHHHGAGFERVDNLPDGSAPRSGADAPFLSASGRYSVFTSNGEIAGGRPAGRTTQVYWHDARTGETRLVSRTPRGRLSNGDSRLPTISDDGRTVAFSSGASNLFGPAEPVLGVENVFVADVRSGRVRQVTSPLPGTPEPRSATGQLSANGRYVALTTDAQLSPEDQNPRFDVYLWDGRRGRTEMVSATLTGEPGDGNSFGPSVSDDGHVAYLSDATGLTEQTPPTGETPAYLWSPRSGNELVSTTPEGTVISPADFPIVSDNARYVTFVAAVPTSRLALFSYDARTRQVRSLPGETADGRDVTGGRMSGDGRLVVVTSSSGIFGTPAFEQTMTVYDRATGRSEVASTRPDVTAFDLSANGRAIGILSAAPDLTPAPDDNGVTDAFVLTVARHR